MRYTGLLLDQVRRSTENVEFTENSGIGNNELLEYINDAQVEIQSAISRTHPQVFQVEKIQNVVSNQEGYALPEDAFLGNMVDLVEYSHSGLLDGYFQLKQGRLPERVNGPVYTSPSFYIRRSGTLLLQPTPSDATGKLRITYQRTIPTIDLRRGKVSAVTLTANSITSLTLDTTLEIDETILESEAYASIVDKDGNVQMRRIPISDIDVNTGIVTVTPGFTFDSGETISVGDWIVKGRDASSHSQLALVCERYLVQYVIWKILKRDSSGDSAEAAEELKMLQGSIVDSFSEPDGDVQSIPLTDDQYLRHDGYY